MSRDRDLAQLGFCAAIVALGVLIIASTWNLELGSVATDRVGPKFLPRIVGGGLIVSASALAVMAWRGSKPHPQEGEDIDLTLPADWKTVGLLVAALVFLIVTVKPLGWTISSAIFFAAVTFVLGSRHWVRNIAIGAVLGVVSFYGFSQGLGVVLPAGILKGIL